MENKSKPKRAKTGEPPASGRKQTITVTVGPKTMAIIEAISAKQQERMPGVVVERTSVATGAMFLGLANYVKQWSLGVMSNHVAE